MNLAIKVAEQLTAGALECGQAFTTQRYPTLVFMTIDANLTHGIDCICIHGYDAGCHYTMRVDDAVDLAEIEERA